MYARSSLRSAIGWLGQDPVTRLDDASRPSPFDNHVSSTQSHKSEVTLEAIVVSSP
jgi:hypothetical protein